MRTYAQNAATLFAMTLMSQQSLFMMYHFDSYAINPIMLRSPKPMVMRDIFLTRVVSSYPNPLSVLYVNSGMDGLCNFLFSWLVVLPVTVVIGWRHSLMLWIGSGLCSSFAYLFQAQVNPGRVSSKWDCCATSNGGFAGLATLSLFMPKTYVTLSRRLPVAWIGIPYLCRCAYEEYIGPRYVENRKRGEVEIRNWGFIGGVFFSLIYSTLFFRTKIDYRLMHTFFNNLSGRLHK